MGLPNKYPIQLTWAGFFVMLFTLSLTFLNLLYSYHQFVGTIRNAPHEIRDSLGNLRQQICEEREALKRQTKAIRAQRETTRRDRQSQLPHYHRRHHKHEHRNRDDSGRSKQYEYVPKSAVFEEEDEDYSAQTLALHYATLRDIWNSFKSLEKPFLVQDDGDVRAEATRRGVDPWAESDSDEKKVCGNDVERRGGHGGDPDGSFGSADATGRYGCDFRKRFTWWRTKASVQKLVELLQKVMLARVAREVTQTKYLVEWLVRERRGQCCGGGEGGGGDNGRTHAGGGGGGGRTETKGDGWVVETREAARENPRPPRVEAVRVEEREDFRARIATGKRRGRSTDEWVIRRHYR